MKIKIQTGDDIIHVDEYDPDFYPLRVPVVGEQIRVSIDKKAYQFDVANILWDFVDGAVIIETA
jgi:hypothetical protein